MSEYKAQILWQRGDENFLDNRYSRKHLWKFDGGAEVAGSSAPGVVPLPMSDETAVDPEEALVAALSSCHMLFFLAFAAKKGFRVDSYVDDAVGVMGKNSDGKTSITLVTLKPKAIFSGEKIPTNEEIEKLHHRAHEECYIANSLKAQVICQPVF
jgi:organic hydroperoxide reductase OsmC/OhrA